ncbi:MAG: helix-turn-helix domain-containing protein [Ruminococcus sp.]|nr:MAG: helix-turn-helix domain-containing protein [Ruminococcus sp.]
MDFYARRYNLQFILYSLFRDLSIYKSLFGDLYKKIEVFFYMSISQNVKRFTGSKKAHSERSIGIFLGVGSSTVNNWIKLDRSIPSEYIIPICEFIGITPYLLLTGKEEPPSAGLSDDEAELFKNTLISYLRKKKIRLVSRGRNYCRYVCRSCFKAYSSHNFSKTQCLQRFSRNRRYAGYR